MNLKKYRESKNLTQQNVADILEVSLRQYVRIEKDASKTKISTLKQLIKLYGINDNDILDFMKEDINFSFNPISEQITTREELEKYYQSFEPKDKVEEFLLNELYEKFLDELF